MHKLPGESDPESLAQQLVPINAVEEMEVAYFIRPCEEDIEPDDISLHDQYISLLVADPILFKAVSFMAEAWTPEDVQADFVDGAMITYRLFNHQADNQALLLPKTDGEIADKYFRNIPSFSEFQEFLNPIVSEVEATDEFFHDALNTYIQDSEQADTLNQRERTALIFGSFAMYDFLRHQYEQLDLRLEQEAWDRERGRA